MTTRAELRTQVRNELNDAGAAPLWPDERLDQWLVEAIREYGRRLPREAADELSSVAGQAAYPLPVDALRVVRVEHPQGVVRVEGDGQAGGGYQVFAGQLVLAPPPNASGEAIGLRYLARYEEPTGDGQTLATPPEDDHLLAWYACGRALGWISTDEAKRQRFERLRGASASGEAERYRQLFQEAVDQRRRSVRSFGLALRSPPSQ